MEARSSACVVLLLLAVACVAPPKVWRTDEASRTLIYEPLGLRFYPRFEDLTRLTPKTYDADGANVAIGYTSTSRRLSLTLYIYPRSFGGLPEPEQHFDSVVSAVRHFNPEAELEQAKSMPLPLARSEIRGYSALLYWPESHQDAGSFLLLIPQGDRFFKLRVTFALDGSREPVAHAWGLSQRFLSSLEFGPL